MILLAISPGIDISKLASKNIESAPLWSNVFGEPSGGIPTKC